MIRQWKDNKRRTMGLDQYAHLRNRKIDWEKYYDDDKEEKKGLFVWRKHARLQTFFARKWREQNQAEQERRDKRDAEGMRKAENPMEIMSSGLGHLGFNSGDEVYITEEVVKDLEEILQKRTIRITSVLMDSFGVSNSKKNP
jgi:hypothetical protein